MKIVKAVMIAVVVLMVTMHVLWANDDRNDDYQTAIARGVVLYQADSLKEAVEVFRQACRAFPDSALPHNACASVLIKMADQAVDIGEYDNCDRFLKQAAGQARNAVDLDNMYVAAHFNLGLTYLKLRRAKDSEQWFRRAIAIDSGYVTAYRHLGYAVYCPQSDEKTNPSDAIDIWRKALEVAVSGDDSMLLHNDIAATLYLSGNSGGARAEYTKTLAIDSLNLDALFGMGQTCADLDSALDYYEQVIAIDPSQVRVFDALGNVLYVQKDVLAAVRSWQRITELPSASDYEKARAYRKIAIDLHLLAGVFKRHRDANFQAAECLELTQKRELYDWGHLYTTRGELDRAIEKYRETIPRIYEVWQAEIRGGFLEPGFIGRRYETLVKEVANDTENYRARYRLAIYQHILVFACELHRDRAVEHAANLVPNCGVPVFVKYDPRHPLETFFNCGNLGSSGWQQVTIGRIYH
ncbi:MAG: tetratricopeptide repeat protein [candidate division Zixibacteria bacterium]|nr:tetratricopeptide repeat protein [candidate division Zixibacteria bacterium]